MKIAWLMVVLVGFTAAACDDPDGSKARKQAALEAWEAPCADVSWLLATTSGSPSTASCPNKHHRMRIQIASAPSNEEFGAVAFCECQRDEADGGDQ